MSGPSRNPKWFQLHLSTAFLLFILLSLGVGANLQRRNIVVIEDERAPNGRQYKSEYDFLVSGWPMPFAKILTNGYFKISEDGGNPYTSFPLSVAWNWLAVGVDLFAMLIVLAPLGFMYEWRIRRRDIAAQLPRCCVWSQFHLSTLVAGSLTASFMLYVNFRHATPVGSYLYDLNDISNSVTRLDPGGVTGDMKKIGTEIGIDREAALSNNPVEFDGCGNPTFDINMYVKHDTCGWPFSALKSAAYFDGPRLIPADIDMNGVAVYQVINVSANGPVIVAKTTNIYGGDGVSATAKSTTNITLRNGYRILDSQALAYNIAIAVAIVLTATMACEIWARRRRFSLQATQLHSSPARSA